MNISPPSPELTPPPEEARKLYQVWARRSLMAAVFCLTLLAFLLAIFAFPKIYYSAGTVIIGDQEPSATAASPAWIQKLGDPADLESQLIIIRSRRMFRLALTKPGVYQAVLRECLAARAFKFALFAEDCAKLKPENPELVNFMEARYTVQAVGRSRVISIGYQSRLADVTSMLANALLISYLEDQRSDPASRRSASSEWILKEQRVFETPADLAPALGIPAPEGTDQFRKQFYAELFTKSNDFEAERRTLVSRARLVSLAEIPQAPYFPKRLPLLTAGITIAGILSILAALSNIGRRPTSARPPVRAVLSRTSRLKSIGPSTWRKNARADAS